MSVGWRRAGKALGKPRAHRRGVELLEPKLLAERVHQVGASLADGAVERVSLVALEARSAIAARHQVSGCIPLPVLMMDSFSNGE